MSLTEVQEAVDVAVGANPAAEFEAADISEAFFGKYTEDQIEEALQNLCKHGPPADAGERIIISISASAAAANPNPNPNPNPSTKYKKAPAPASAGATPPSKEMLLAYLKELAAKNKTGMSDHTYTLKMVRLFPSSARTVTH